MPIDKVERLDTLFAYKAVAIVPGLSGADRRVGGAILDHFNYHDGRCDPSVERIAGLLELNDRTVLRAVAKLDRCGLILKDRHGGRYLQNSYEPQWARFRAIEAEWKARFNANSAASARTRLSSRTRQKSQAAGDASVTQTLLRNQSNEPVRQGEATALIADPRGGERKSGQAGRERGPATSAPTTLRPMRIPSPSSREAWRTAAEKRWCNDLFRAYGSHPDVYGAILEAIDAPLRIAATEAELQRDRGGLPFLLDELRRRQGGGRGPQSMPPAGNRPALLVHAKEPENKSEKPKP